MVGAGGDISISRQCELLGVSRTSFYYRPVAVNDLEDRLIKRLSGNISGDDVAFEGEFLKIVEEAHLAFLQSMLLIVERAARRLTGIICSGPAWARGLQACQPKTRRSQPPDAMRAYSATLGHQARASGNKCSSHATFVRSPTIWSKLQRVGPMQHRRFILPIVSFARADGASLPPARTRQRRNA